MTVTGLHWLYNTAVNDGLVWIDWKPEILGSGGYFLFQKNCHQILEECTEEEYYFS